MIMYYLVYLPCLRVMQVSDDRNVVLKAYREIGHDYDEDYSVVDEKEFVKFVQGLALARKDLDKG